MIIYTIGFTKTSAAGFFERIESANVRSVMDVRLKPDSQLSGFAKKRDLPYFLQKLVQIDYTHATCLAPSSEMLNDYKKGLMGWAEYERAYISLLDERNVSSELTPSGVDGVCLLCSEFLPHRCHRRIAAEYLIRNWGAKAEIRHL